MPLPDHLNWSNLAELTSNQFCLSDEQRFFLLNTTNRIRLFPHRFNRNQGYPETAGLILMSDWNHRQRFCLCSNRKSICKLWKFCHYCRHLYRMRLMHTFLPHFSAGNWYFLTISFDGQLSFESPLLDDPTNYWAACGHAIHEMVESRQVIGAIKVEELSICSFNPLTVLPHCHILLFTEQISPSFIDETNALVESYRPVEFNPDLETWEVFQDGRIHHPVTTRLARLEAQENLAKTISYLIKPIDVVTPYRASLEACEGAPETVRQLNQNVCEFFLSYSETTHSRRQLQYFGTLDARRRSRFVGVSPACREAPANRSLVRELLRSYPTNVLLEDEANE